MSSERKGITVHVVAFAPKGKYGGVGGFDWFYEPAAADAHMRTEEEETGYAYQHYRFDVVVWNKEHATDSIDDCWEDWPKMAKRWKETGKPIDLTYE